MQKEQQLVAMGFNRLSRDQNRALLAAARAFGGRRVSTRLAREVGVANVAGPYTYLLQPIGRVFIFPSTTEAWGFSRRIDGMGISQDYRDNKTFLPAAP